MFFMQMIDKIHNMVLSDWQIKVREIVDATGMSKGTVFSIFHEKLGVKKISVRWVPCLLSEENKHNRVVHSEAILPHFRRNPDVFLRRYITVDGTWIHHYTPETKEQPTQLVFKGDRPNRCLFWGPSEILLFGWLKKVGETLGKVYTIKRRLCWKIKKIYTKWFVFISFSKNLLNKSPIYMYLSLSPLIKLIIFISLSIWN